MSTKVEPAAVYGLMAEFDDPEDLIEATQHAYDQGYRMMEAYTPFPVDGVAEALGFHRNRIPADRCSSAACWEESAASSCSGSRRSFIIP